MGMPERSGLSVKTTVLCFIAIDWSLPAVIKSNTPFLSLNKDLT